MILQVISQRPILSKDFSANAVQVEGDSRKRTSDLARTQDPLHRAMGDEGFATVTNSSWLKLHESV